VSEACEVAARRRLFPHALAVAASMGQQSGSSGGGGGVRVEVASMGKQSGSSGGGGGVRVEVAQAYAVALAAERRYEVMRCRLTLPNPS